MVNLFPARLLGRHVGHRSHDRHRLGQVNACLQLRQAKIHDLRLALFRKHDIRRLDVPVDDASLMGFFEAFGNLAGNVQSLFHR